MKSNVVGTARRRVVGGDSPLAVAGVAGVVLSIAGAAAAQPLYDIIPISVPGQASSNGQGISSSGNAATGTSNSTAVLWTQGAGTVALPALTAPARPFSLAQAVNDSGVVVGTGATTFFGSSPLPLIWSTPGSVAQLPLPAGQTLGRAYGVNNGGMVVGSVDGGSSERAATYTTGSGSVITQTMPNGGILRTAYGVNDGGRIVGQALDPTNAAVTKGFYLDPGAGTAADIGALTGLGHNSAIAFSVSSDGRIAGTSSFNSGVNSRPFIWDEVGGMLEVPLLAGTSQGGGRGVNASGWVVGTMSSATSIPFLFDGATTYALNDLIPAGSGWDLVSGTSNGAFGIGDNGSITGRGLLNGQVTGFVMVLVPAPGGLGLLAAAGVVVCARRRRVR